MLTVPHSRAPVRHRVGDVVRAHGDEYAHLYPCTPRQRGVLRALARCRTEELGGFVATCDSCDYRRVIYNPCRNRHCPSCEGQAAAQWLEELRGRILPCRYFHVVFTLPSELRWLAFQNAALVYGLMLRSAGETLVEMGRDPRHLGAQLGATAVLHTWRRDLQLHPHVHCLVTGGGLSDDGSRWTESPRARFLAPIRLLGARFRDKILRRLTRAHARGALRFSGGCRDLAAPGAFTALQRDLRRKSWLVYSKAAFGDLDHLLRYLGRYTHRVGISDRRLLEVTDDRVTFATKNGGQVSLSPFDFLSRFLLHALPRGFVKIRHYGLFATQARARLEQARVLLADYTLEPDATEPPDLPDPDDLPDVPCPQCLFGRVTLTERFSSERVSFPELPPPDP